MIEDFVQGLQQAELEAKDIIRAARERVQSIQRDSEVRLLAERSSAESTLRQRLDALDRESDHQVRLAEDQLRRDLKEQLEETERGAHDRRGAALNFLLSEIANR